MSYSKECPAVIVTETQTGKFVNRSNCRYIEGQETPPCELATKSGSNNNTHVSEGYCLRGMPDDIPEVRSI